MPRRNLISGVIVIGVALFLAAPLFAQTDTQPPPDAKTEKNVDEKPEKKADAAKKQKSEDPERKFAGQCGLDFDKATKRTFINSVSRGWREYTDTRLAPELAEDEE